MKVSTDITNGPGTTVGVNVALSGTLKDQNDIAIFGMVDGEVISEKSVMVGQSAQVKGPLKGQLITVAGVVRGSINATDKLEILETGKVFGSIDAKDLVVHSGALIVGKISMPSGEEAETVPDGEDKKPSDSSEEDILKPEVEEI